ncbi:MAG: hypothetical protein SRB2_02980 [Desulfobacteraceae bacterium Eth-SRB2]|nr:MAG: hypothetical protein SRB2_02980 [Desulfobacteraceae bacterium Eth-SRB2]
MFKFNAIISIVLVALLGIAYTIDKPLNPDINALAQDEKATRVSHHENAYIHFLGIYCSPNKDPVTTGIRRLESYEKIRKNTPDIAGKVLREEDERKFVKVRTKDINKELLNKGLSELVDISEQDKKVIESMIENNQLLINRYKQLYALPKYQNIASISIAEINPNIFMLLQVHRLVNAKIKLDIINEDFENSLEELMAKIDFARRIFPYIENVVNKMVFELVIREDIDIIDDLLNLKKHIGKNYLENLSHSIREFSKEEVSIQRILKKEFTRFKSAVDKVRREDSFSNYSLIEKMKYKILFKPNRTLNNQFRLLKEYATQNEKRPFDFLTKNIEEKELSYFHIKFVLNPIGYFLDGLFIEHQYKRLASYLQTLEGFRRLVFFKLLARIHKFNKDGIEKEIQAYNKKLNKEYFAVKSINLSENKKELYFEPFPLSKGRRNRVQFTLVD